MKNNVRVCACVLLLIFCVMLIPIKQAFAEEVGSSAECMAVLEVSTNRLLYGKNLNKKRPMASTTKIMTAITVLENCNDLNKTVAVPAKAVGVEGSSIYLQSGEKVKIIDLLYGLMLQSGNDCAEALAIITSGSTEKFAELMNDQAVKIGVKDSNFVNPHGLHNDNHYTTAHDLSLISSYALKNPEFKKIVATKTHNMTWEGRNYNRILHNKNKILNTFDGGDGVKTGFTKKAGRCLVSSATRNGMQVVTVVLNCGPMFEECSALMEKAFNEYSLVKVCAAGEMVGNVAVSGGKSKNIQAETRKELFYPLKKGEAENITKDVKFSQNLSAPVKQGDECGKIKIYLKNQLLFDEKLFSIESVGELDVLDKLRDLIHDFSK